MSYKPKIHHRRSIRLKGYDYSQAGAYFLTICAQNKKCLFGDIVDGEMRLNDAGMMIQTVWYEIPAHYPGIETDEFVIMPNHVHGIAVIVGAAPRGRPDVGSRPGLGGHPDGGQARNFVGAAPRGRPDVGDHPDPGEARTLSLPDVVHRFKTMTTKRYADGVKNLGWQPFPGKLWQRNYWEHIVRNEFELQTIREYICNNPTRWELDKLFMGTTPRGRPDSG